MATEENEKLKKSDLEQLLGEEIVKYDATYLTAVGDNWGSIMLAVKAVTKSGKDLELVAKLFPEPEVVRDIFHSPLSMRKEIDMYLMVKPEFQKIQEDNAVPANQMFHIFCNCPGARLTFEGYDDERLADENSVLLLENLKSQGYRTADRIAGLDIKHTELVITRIAKFHATGIAIKLKRPEAFKSKIMKACEPFKVKHSKTKQEDEVRADGFVSSLLEIPVCEQNISLIREHVKRYVDYAHSAEFRIPKEPFATMIHDDLWTNNMMFKYKSETDNEPIDLRIFDFQVVRYGSPIEDVILFLFTSTQPGIVSQHLDRLLKLYHDTFIEWLHVLGCETNAFHFHEFLKEVQSFAPSQVTHILYWLLPITLQKEQVDDFKIGDKPDRKYKFNEYYVQKACEAVTVFVNRNWL